MKTFVYDRQENGNFIPNGYPVEYEYIDEPMDYKNKFGFEKTVHFLFANKSINVNKKLSSEVEEDFIYPVEQYGALEKLTGEDEKYSKFCFLKHIKKDTLEKLQNSKGKLVVFALEESKIVIQSLIFLHKKLKQYNILPSQLILLTGTNWSVYEEYIKACDMWLEPERINVVNTNSQMYLKGQDLLMGEFSNNIVRKGDFLKKEKRKHQFLCFNSRIRPARYVMLAMLYHNNLIENNLVSFDLSNEDLSAGLGPGGKVHKPTVSEIIGNTKLLHKYISYQDELLKMSPSTIDYKDLTKVIGPGCENKEPYLNSYFSLVTETVFNEETWCISEKIWRPIIHYHPFILQGSPFTLRQIKDLGFKTFSPYINESYDEEKNVKKRMEKLTEEIVRLCSMSREKMHDWYYSMEEILVYNRNNLQKYGSQYSTYLDESVNTI